MYQLKHLNWLECYKKSRDKLSRCRRPDADAAIFAKSHFAKIHIAFDESRLFALVANNIEYKLPKKEKFYP